MLAKADDPDTESPTNPANLTVLTTTDSSVLISWDASTDNVGVVGYDIYNGSVLEGTVTTTSFTFDSLSPGTSYTFGVIAKDAAGNVWKSRSDFLLHTLIISCKYYCYK